MARREILPRDGVKRTVPTGFLELDVADEDLDGLREVVDSGGGESWVTVRSRLDDIASSLRMGQEPIPVAEPTPTHSSSSVSTGKPCAYQLTLPMLLGSTWLDSPARPRRL
jgi:hypothetical protein